MKVENSSLTPSALIQISKPFVETNEIVTQGVSLAFLSEGNSSSCSFLLFLIFLECTC